MGRSLWRWAGALCDTADHVETSEVDSRAIDRADPTDAAGDPRSAAERSPEGRGNAGDPGGPEKAGGRGIGLRGAYRRDVGERKPVSDVRRRSARLLGQGPLLRDSGHRSFAA